MNSNKLVNIPPQAQQQIMQSPDFQKRYGEAIKKLEVKRGLIPNAFTVWVTRALFNIPFGSLNVLPAHYESWLFDAPESWHVELLNRAALLILSSEPNKVKGKWYQKCFSYREILEGCTGIADEVQALLLEKKNDIIYSIHFGDKLKA